MRLHGPSDVVSGGLSGFSGASEVRSLSSIMHLPALPAGTSQIQASHHHLPGIPKHSPNWLLRTFHPVNSTVYGFPSLSFDISLNSNTGICTHCTISVQVLHKNCKPKPTLLAEISGSERSTKPTWLAVSLNWLAGISLSPWSKTISGVLMWLYSGQLRIARSLGSQKATIRLDGLNDATQLEQNSNNINILKVVEIGFVNQKAGFVNQGSFQPFERKLNHLNLVFSWLIFSISTYFATTPVKYLESAPRFCWFNFTSKWVVNFTPAIIGHPKVWMTRMAGYTYVF